MPSYAVLMYGCRAYRRLGPLGRDAFWAAYRSLLAQEDDRLAAPVAYSLWVDYFEDSETVAEAWGGLTSADLGPRGLERLLHASGPVPWRLKAPLYESLLPDPAWHPAIFSGLVNSRFDTYGRIDVSAASRLLDRLQLPPGTAGLAELRRALRRKNSPRRRARS